MYESSMPADYYYQLKLRQIPYAEWLAILATATFQKSSNNIPVRQLLNTGVHINNMILVSFIRR